MCRNKIKHVPESYFKVEFDRDSSQAQPAAKGENGREKPFTIFTYISFYSVGNRNGKVRNRIRSVKSGPSKTDKSEQKCLGIDRHMVI
jgi:hypothetical protein